MRIALASEQRVYLLATERMERPDVATALGAGHEHCGFRAGLDKEDLPPGLYTVGVVISADGEAPRYLPLGKTSTVGG